MYHGKNPTALQSQQWLADSLTGLMMEKPYSQITILDICKKADLSRQTFYNFFNTKEEILRYCLRQKYEEQFSKYKRQSAISIDEIVNAFSVVLAENRTLLAKMLENSLDGIISDEISKCVSLFADFFVREELRDNYLPYNIALLGGALAHLLVYWFRQENPVSMEELINILTKFLGGNLYTIPDRN